MKARQHSRRNTNRNVRDILAPQGLLQTRDCTVPRFGNSQLLLPTSEPAAAEFPTSHPESQQDIPHATEVADATLPDFLSQKYPYWWVLPLCFANLLAGIFVSYSIRLFS